MRVFIAGATGTLGRPTVRALVAAGHDVRALARDTDRAERVRELGAEPIVADLFDAGAMRQAVAGSEAVLHLATRIPPLAGMRRRDAWRENDRLRSQGAAVLVNAPWPLASACDAERETGRFAAAGGAGVVLRFAVFYATYAPSTRDTIRLA